MLPTRVLLSASPSSGSPKEPQSVVVAVDDERPLRIERRRRLAVERLQRDVDRAREVLVLKFVRRQNLDELGAFFAPKALELVSVDWCGHVASLVGFTRSNVPPPAVPSSTR
jgi:hypothetical protein